MVRTRSVTLAADELYVTQPSVSAALSALSKEVGVTLTERVGRNIRPSAAGDAFAPFAADVIGLLDQGSRAAREAAGAAGLELRIAAVTTAAEYVVPPLMRAFSELRPELTLTLEVGNREHVFDRVASHEADLAIGGRPPREGRLEGEPFLPNPIVLITAPDDPLASERSVPVRELEDRVWLLREAGSGTRTMTEEFLASHYLRPRVLTLGSNGAIKRAAAMGLGVSLQSASAAALELELEMLATISVPEELPSREWFALRPALGGHREPVHHFLEFVTGEEAREALERARLPASVSHNGG
ncbi:MAG: LysR family transcriptional regulator [Thermoleophilaceae bacterium]|nr:LysR family transcriptional regulator [Thermoleophilaceae bacterium]